MVQRNLVIAIIIIVLFLVIAIIGYIIYAVQDRIGLMGNRRMMDDDEV